MGEVVNVLDHPAKAKLKAYKVTDAYEGTGGIVFALHNVVARREGAHQHGDGDFDSVECVRAPQFDQYAPGPVPDTALSDDGWYLSCGCGCDRRIEHRTVLTQEYQDEDGNWIDGSEAPAWVDRRNGSLWCDRWGPLRLAETHAKQRWGKRMARTMARLALPADCRLVIDETGDEGNSRDGVYIGHKDRYGPPAPTMRWGTRYWSRTMGMPQTTYDKFMVGFKFPGAQYVATWESDSATPWVCQGDLFAYWTWRGMAPEAALRRCAENGIHVPSEDVEEAMARAA